MREYAKKPETQSRALDSNPRASKQASIDEILQTYKNRTSVKPVQLQSKDEDELFQCKFDTTQLHGINVNDNKGLEKEADIQSQSVKNVSNISPKQSLKNVIIGEIVQRATITDKGLDYYRQCIDNGLFDDTEIFDEIDSRNISVLVRINLGGNVQVHIHFKYTDGESVLDIKRGQNYLLYLDETDSRVDDFIERCISDKKYRELKIKAYLINHSHRPIKYLTGSEQLISGDYF